MDIIERIDEHLDEGTAFERLMFLFTGTRSPEFPQDWSSKIRTLMKDPGINKIANELWMKIQMELN